MSQNIKITIPEPCHENWNLMTPTQQGRHCTVCTKEVIDFTTKTDQEVALLLQSETNVCGRMRLNQISREIVVPQKISKYKYKIAKLLSPWRTLLLFPLALSAAPELLSQNSSLDTTKIPIYQSLGIGSHIRQGKICIPQSYNIQGTVQDAQGNIIPGASIDIKSTYKGVQADHNGRYHIQALLGETLIFSFAGHQSYEVLIKSQDSIIDAQLEEQSLIGEATQFFKKLNANGSTPKKKNGTKQ